jgi:adenylate cyclase
MARERRRLAAIVSADVVGYSRLRGRDEPSTLARWKTLRREVIDQKLAEYGGRIVNAAGDNQLLEFPSVVDAVHCAVDVQRGMAERDTVVPSDEQILWGFAELWEPAPISVPGRLAVAVLPFEAATATQV